ncbi:hypothetical protein ACVW00_000588 [Marmoricola sp. URHA0025 HA25]
MRRALLLLAGVLVLGVLPLVPAGAISPALSDAGFSRTKKLEREFVDAGVSTVVDSRDVTVSVDHTTQVQSRERIHVSWSGAHPSGARASNPYGENGLNQEYPVVIMQCRGLDDPSLPEDQQLEPQTCWTSTKLQRSQVQDPTAAIWARDLHASDADRQVKSGLDPYPGAACDDSSSTFYAHVTPFVAADGKVYKGCTSATMPPEAAVGSSFPPAEQEAFTGTDGTGNVSFEVRTAVENESLGCSYKVACSLVVIPIMGLSCVDKDPAFLSADNACRGTGQFPEGSSNFANAGVDPSVSPVYWWSASNWRNRFSVPLSFALPPSACDLLDDRAPTPFYGSELLSQAALQWAPAFCLRKDRFKWQQNSMSDEAAFSQMQQGVALAAEVSGKREGQADTPVGYAPTAVTGFAVSYAVDKPENAGEFTGLRLNARLLAKLLTESYPASSRGAGHPGLEHNPLALNLDPEFRALNPGMSDIAQEAAASVMTLSTSSDVISALTGYIARDPDAKAFLDGQADPWGMTVNPSYKGITVPTSQWPLLDTYVPASNDECLKANPAPYLPQVAAPVSSLRQIAAAVLDAWPLLSTKCDRPTPSDPWKLGRVDRQGVGTRFLLGITTLGDAERFGLHTASLAVAGGAYVAPDDASMAAAIALAKPGKKYQPFTIPDAALGKSSTAYPGTMIVYTAARLTGVPKRDAAKVAQFVDVSTTEGQVRGRGNGQLPEGYLPILDSGPTKALYSSARTIATAIRAQKAPAVKPAAGNGAGSAAQTSAPAGTAPPAAAPGGGRGTDRRHLGSRSGAGREDHRGHFTARRLPAARHPHGRHRRGDHQRLQQTGPAPTGCAMTTLTSPARARSRIRPRPAPVAIRPGEADEAVSLVSSAFTMVAIVSLWFVFQVLVLSGFSQARDQHLLYGELRQQLAAGTAPTGPGAAPGDPVAVVTVPHLGISQVVVEGTASGDLRAGPGHRRDTVLPGQRGISLVYGRASTYGAPFRHLSTLQHGDQVVVQGQQGRTVFKVDAVRRAGDPLPAPPTGQEARLTLVSAEGSGRLAGLRAEDVVYVDATAETGEPAPARAPTAIPSSERAMSADSSALPMLALALALLAGLAVAITSARQRFSVGLVWVIASPVAIALSWFTTDVVVRLLPNLI